MKKIKVRFVNHRIQNLPVHAHLDSFPEVELYWDRSDFTGNDLVQECFSNDQEKIVGIKCGNRIRDLNVKIDLSDSDQLDEVWQVTLLGTESNEGLNMIRHTTAHIMASAIKKLFPDVKITIGPVIENGFYYDFDDIEIKNEDFKKIEKEMKKIIDAKISNFRKEISREEALEMFADEPYKIELINDFTSDETISVYTMGNFMDLCRGPHIPHTGMVKAYKLIKIAGAYWKGESRNKMLTRVYGTAFPKVDELHEYIEKLKLAEARDHNKLGRSLKIFTSHEAVGQGLPLLTERGSAMKRLLERMVEDEETKRGYWFTQTPYLSKNDLFKISGHWQHYKDSMFVISEEDEELALRPMTCPFHYCLYNSQKHSYRDLPIRYAENSVLFRNESSGEMHGLIRVRQFTLSDGHIICRPDQIADEFKRCLELNQFYLKRLGFDDYWFRFSKWDPKNKIKYIDNPVAWERTQNQMKEILDALGMIYVEADGEAAFYGPKLDIQMQNVHGKEDTVMTIQIDFGMPERFQMTYVNSADNEETPMVIHRSSLGCYERTLAMLIEKYGGDFPFWLAPVQVMILSIKHDVVEYVNELDKKLKASSIRSMVNIKEQSLGRKIRDARAEKIPLVITIGKQEMDSRKISFRTSAGEVFNDYSFDIFITICQTANQNYTKQVSL